VDKTDLWKEIMYYSDTLEKAIRELKDRGANYARCEHDYRVRLSKRLTELRADGEKVTHLADIAKGEPETAKLRMERDIAECLYKSCLEGINVYKVKIKILESQLQREWGQAGRESK
jgi:hypothetical protein